MPTEVEAVFSPADGLAVCAGAARIANSGMVLGSAGNISLRRGDRVLITPRGAQLEALAPEDLIQVSLSDGEIIARRSEAIRPSSETALHRSVYAMTDAGAVVHTHAHFCTVLSTLIDELPAIHYMINALGGPVRVARYETFGTDALAQSVCEALEDRTGALMANHGAVVAGRDIEHAVELALLLEWLASLYYAAICAGTPTILRADQLGAVRTQAKELSYGPGGGES